MWARCSASCPRSRATCSFQKRLPEGGAALLTGGYDSQTMDGLLRQADSARLIAICTTLQRAAADMNVSVNRRTDAELCLLKLCDETLSGDLSAINARLARLEQQMTAGVRYAAAEGAAQAEKPAPAKTAAKPTAVEDEAPPPWEGQRARAGGRIALTTLPRPTASRQSRNVRRAR